MSEESETEEEVWGTEQQYHSDRGTCNRRLKKKREESKGKGRV